MSCYHFLAVQKGDSCSLIEVLLVWTYVRMSELIEHESEDEVLQNEQDMSPERSSCDNPATSNSSTSAKLIALEAKLNQVLDAFGTFVQGPNSLQVPSERGGRGEGSTVASRVSMPSLHTVSEFKRPTRTATISKRPASPSPPSAASRPRLTAAEPAIATPPADEFAQKLPPRRATSDVRGRDFVPPKGRDFFAALKPLSFPKHVSRDCILPAPEVTRNPAGPTRSSSSLSATAEARGFLNTSNWVSKTAFNVAPTSQVRSVTSELDHNEEGVPTTIRRKFQPVWDVVHDILPRSVVEPPQERESPSTHPLFQESKPGPLPFSLSSDLTSREVFMTPLNATLAELPAKGKFLSAAKVPTF